MFLSVSKKKVVDVGFQAAIPEVVEDLAADPPVIGVPAVPQVDEVSHLEVDNIYLENAVSQIAVNLENGLDIDYYEVQINGTNFQTTLHPVTLKAGPRTAAPAREFVEIVANGQDVGSALMEV